MGCHFLLQGIFPTQGSNPHLLYRQADSLPLSHQGSPGIWELLLLLLSHSVRPHRRKPTRLPCPRDSPGKNTGVGCHCLLQCMKVKSEREVAQSCRTLSDPMDYSLPGSSIHGIFQARILESGASAFSESFFSTFYFSILCFTFMHFKFLKKMKLVHQRLNYILFSGHQYYWQPSQGYSLDKSSYCLKHEVLDYDPASMTL